MSETLSLGYQKEDLASLLYNRWGTWDAARENWKDEKKELRQYIHATDTRKTTNSQLPWKNSTVTPKITQIRDNLHANYIAALFPREKWFKFEPSDQSSATLKKKQAVESYMLQKMKQHEFQIIVSQLVLDYIDYGNVFVGHEFVNETKTDPVTQEVITVYRGPRPYRISPLDIVFDPTARTFKDSPCIVRRLMSIGDLVKNVATRPNLEYKQDVVDKIKSSRYKGSGILDHYKSDGYAVDGFSSMEAYVSSGMVELHDFYGDTYDEATNEWKVNRVITVADGRWILRDIENRSWMGYRPIYHCGWRLRADNLWAQGPLDQLVGMQYRIDHLENLKADVFDQIAHPVVTVKGTTVEEFEFGPEEKIYLGVDGVVEVLRPDAAALNANFEINELMGRMEELAGAPRQAMGIRTPGEKTKYEVQVLETGAGRIFQNKITWFERNLIEPLLNSMLEEGVRALDTVEEIKITDPELGVETFEKVTKADVTAKGKLVPMGARHFAEEARFIQELNETLKNTQGLATVNAHFSGKAIAKAIGEVMGWNAYGIVKNNAAIAEQMETRRLVNVAQETVQAEAAMPSELQSGDMEAPVPEEGAPIEQPPTLPQG
jgi:hypothetical protein